MTVDKQFRRKLAKRLQTIHSRATSGAAWLELSPQERKIWLRLAGAASKACANQPAPAEDQAKDDVARAP